MCANAALGQADSLHEIVKGVKAQRRKSELSAYNLHHAVVLGSAGRGVGFEPAVLVTFLLLDNAPRDELQVRAGRSKADISASVDQRRS